MLPKRKIWLERATNWGIAVAVPLVAIGGFKLLAHARDGAQPLPGQLAPPAASGRILAAPPIDASVPPVVTLQRGPVTAPPAAADPRCTALAGARADAADHTVARVDRQRASEAQARRLGCLRR